VRSGLKSSRRHHFFIRFKALEKFVS